MRWLRFALLFLVTSSEITTRVEFGVGLLQLSRSQGKPNKVSTDSRFTLIHVGKCAGQTVNKFLEHNDVKVDRVHARIPDIHRFEHDGVLVVLRDPISRVISAFNWRHPSTRPPDGRHCCPHMDHNPSELAFYSCFDHANDFAEALDDDSFCGRMARDVLKNHTKHIGMGYEYYFPEDVMSAMKTHRVFTLHQEWLAQDLHDFMKWNNIKETRDEVPVSHTEDSKAGVIYPMKDDTYLSHKGRKKLRAHLARDYEIYHELEHMSVDISGTPALQSAIPHS